MLRRCRARPSTAPAALAHCGVLLQIRPARRIALDCRHLRAPCARERHREQSDASVQVEDWSRRLHRVQHGRYEVGQRNRLRLKERFRVPPQARLLRHARASGRQADPTTSGSPTLDSCADRASVHRATGQAALVRVARQCGRRTARSPSSVTDSARWLPSTLSVSSTDTTLRAIVRQPVHNRRRPTRGAVRELPRRCRVAQACACLRGRSRLARRRRETCARIR